MANATQNKFGYPQSVIAKASHRSLETRQQPFVPGPLALVCKEAAIAQRRTLNSHLRTLWLQDSI